MLTLINDPYFSVEVLNKPIQEAVLENYGRFYLGDISNFSRLKAYELSSITFNCTGFPHSVPMQLRTHRHQITFDVQSQRFTEKRALDVSKGVLQVDEVFYLRPPLNIDGMIKRVIHNNCIQFHELINRGFPAEAARDVLPQGIRQNFVFSCTLRTLLHILDLRYKPDAQAEIQTLSQMLLDETAKVFPNAIQWYTSNRALKGILAP